MALSRANSSKYCFFLWLQKSEKVLAGPIKRFLQIGPSPICHFASPSKDANRHNLMSYFGHGISW